MVHYDKFVMTLIGNDLTRRMTLLHMSPRVIQCVFQHTSCSSLNPTSKNFALAKTPLSHLHETQHNLHFCHRHYMPSFNGNHKLLVITTTIVVLGISTRATTTIPFYFSFFLIFHLFFCFLLWSPTTLLCVPSTSRCFAWWEIHEYEEGPCFEDEVKSPSLDSMILDELDFPFKNYMSDNFFHLKILAFSSLHLSS